MKFFRFSWLLWCLPAGSLAGQDLHFSQFYQQPLQRNPAETGVFQGDWRVAGIYRGQWASVPVNYRSFAGAFDWKPLRREHALLAVGFAAAYDRAGDAGLTWAQLGATAAVSHTLGETQALSAGFGVGLAQRAFDLSGLRFKNQWTGDVFDPARATGENLAQSSGLAPTLSAGLHWHYRSADNRNGGDIGLGASHLNRPAVHFAQQSARRLPVRLDLAARGVFQLNERADAVAFGLARQMGPNREIVAGGGLRRWLDEATAVQFSLAVRLGDAVIPAFQLERDGWTWGLSYDWNISRFDLATRGRGGIELSAVFRSLPAPPVKAFKSCPIF